MSIDDDEPIWLTADQIIVINAHILDPGERHLVLNLGYLQGALDRPHTLWHYEGVSDIAILAARLLQAIAKAHAFEQGNKRTALHCGMAFAMTNGLLPNFPDEDWLAELVEDLANGKHQAEIEMAQVFRDLSDRLLNADIEANQ